MMVTPCGTTGVEITVSGGADIDILAGIAESGGLFPPS